MLRAAKAPQPIGEGSAAALPDTFTILPWGRHETAKGVVIVNEHTMAVLEANQRLIKRPTIKGDFQHESAKPDGVVKHPINFAVRSAVPRVVKDVGIIVEKADWTPAGLKHVPVDYSDISATPYLDEQGRVIALHSFALCDHGEVDGAEIGHAIPATLSADLALLTPTPPTPKKAPMNPRLLLLTTLSHFGVTVPADASDDQLSALVGQLPKPAAPAAAPVTLSADSIKEILKAELAPLSAEIATLKADKEGAAIQRLVDTAVMQGKLVTLSAEDLGKLGEASAKAYLDKLPAGQVPVSQRTPVALSAGPSLTPQHEADYLQAHKDLGLPAPEADKK